MAEPQSGGHIYNLAYQGIWSMLFRRGAFLAILFGGRLFLFAGFVLRRTLVFAFFCFARFAAFLRTGPRLALPRFESFLCAETRFFALAIRSLL